MHYQPESSQLFVATPSLGLQAMTLDPFEFFLPAQRQFSFPGQYGTIHSLVAFPGHLAAGSFDTKVYIWKGPH